MAFLVGIDIGTTSSRVTIYDLDGVQVVETHSPHVTTHPFPGWAEQEPEEWWNSVCIASRNALSQFLYPKSSIKGISITSMRQSFVCLGKDMKPLRSGILWYDTRHASQVDWVRSNIGNEVVYKVTGSPPGRRAIYKAMWIKENELKIYNETCYFAFIPDFITYRLTKEIITSPGTSFASGCLNVSNPTFWAKDFIEQCGIDPNKWIDNIQLPGFIAGYVCSEASSQTGFSIGTPVVLSAGDQACGNLGVGVCRPGMLGINGGTSCALQTPANNLPINDEMSYFIDFSSLGNYVVENGITSGTAALTEWFRDGFGHVEKECSSNDNELWNLLYNLAEEAPVGNMGLMLIPYLRGANGPLWDPKAQGVLIGLTTSHSRSHLMRALLEGLAYESRRILESMEKGTSTQIDAIRTYGGASKSRVWNQIFADVLGRPVVVTKDTSPVSLGAAITAGYGVGLFADYVEAVGKLIQIQVEFQPTAERFELYNELYSHAYIKIYDRVKDVVNAISTIQQNHQRL
ncbi:hypothetical protein KJ742_01165 [Patescibacteria group bacterium]|nr:hypothetical protein [Patescibacteria group bacterium]